MTGSHAMHVEAVGAAVDLRGADLDKLHEARLEASLDLLRSGEPSLHDIGGGGEDIDLGSHWTILSWVSDDMTSKLPSIVTSSRRNFPSPLDLCRAPVTRRPRRLAGVSAAGDRLAAASRGAEPSWPR